EFNDQEEEDNANSTNNANAASTNKINVGGGKISIKLPIDTDMPELYAIVYLDDDEDVGAEDDMNNLNAFMPVNHILTTRIHKDHLVEQIIGDLNLAPQTRRMIKNLEEHEKPKKVIHALKDPSWIEAIQEELFQFNLQEVWTLVDLLNGKRDIGYTQEEGIDYDEVFSPVVRIEAVRIFLAYASFKDFVVYHMDVKNAFLYGKIEKEVYVCQPSGFEDLDFPNRVYKVENALYESHQAPRAWYKTLSIYLLDNRFQRGTIDKTLFIKWDKGLQEKQKEDGIFISQDKYVTEILKKFGFTDVRTASTSMETQKPFLKDEDDSPFDLVAYTDSDYARANLDRMSTIRGCQFLGCRLISWQCKKQVVVANSTTKAEEGCLEWNGKAAKDDFGLMLLGITYYYRVTTAGLVNAARHKLTTARLVNAVRHNLVLLVQVNDVESDFKNTSIQGFIQSLNRFQSLIYSLITNPNSILEKPTECEGFEQIVDFLNANPIKYALTVNPTIYTLCIEQFWATAKVKTVNGEEQLQALVDKKKVIITEASIRRDLQLEDAEGIGCLPNATIFEELTRMGYEKLSQMLTFYKAFFSPQWKFLIHTILQCLIFLDQQVGDMSTHDEIYVIPSHTKKVFRNMKRVGKRFSGNITPLFLTMMAHAQEKIGEGSANPTDPQHTPTITQPSSSKPQKKQKPMRTKRKDIEIPQSSVPITPVADEAVYEERDESLERAATTATNLDVEQDMGNIAKTQYKETPNEPSSLGTSSGGGPRRQDTMGDTIAQTRSENVSKHSNDPLLSGEDSIQLKELMEFCTKFQERVLDLENTKTAQAQEITTLKKRVKKLERRKKSRTHGLKRLYKVGLSARIVSSDDEASLGDQEDASKQRRKIHDIDENKDITLASTHFNIDPDMFGVHDLDGDEVIDENVDASAALRSVKPKDSAATTTTTAATTITTASTRPKAKGIVIQEQEQAPTPIISSKDKGKSIMEDRIAREKEEANATLIAQWNDIQDKLKFNSIKDANKLLEAVEKRFGGNAATRKTQRNILKQQYENFTAPSSEMLDQTFDRLQKLVSQLELLDEKLSQ
ncbi:putative ribonuclease H-like domain-containing protein, partial [Tanacetum coccineum]